MEKNTRFYKCSVCGNQVGLIRDMGPKIMCCGKPMDLMVSNDVTGAEQKHIPVCKIENNKIYVSIGEVEHPMEQDHYIEWIAIVGENRTTRIALKPGQECKAVFEYMPNSTIYAYCNKHGLWCLDSIE